MLTIQKGRGSMLKLSTGNIVYLLTKHGIGKSQFIKWLDRGICIPAKGVEGKGFQYRFKLPHAFGIFLAAVLYNSPRGCQVSYVKYLSTLFDDMDERKFSEFIRVPTLWYEDVSIAEVYKDFSKHLSTIEPTPKGRPGRRMAI